MKKLVSETSLESCAAQNIAKSREASSPHRTTTKSKSDVCGLTEEVLAEEELTLYNLPKYYDIAFSRDVSGEINFYISCFKKYCNFEVKRILEPACGSGVFLLTFPKYGYYITGYDLSPKMVEYANEKIEKAGLSDRAKAIVGDMLTMRFNEKFDAAIIAINSLGYLHTDQEIVSHFKAVSESLVKGGLYIVEISCACQNLEGEKKPDETWFVEMNGIKIEATWNPYHYDTKNKLRCVKFRMRGQDNGSAFEFEEEHKLRLWYYEDFKRLAQEGGFKIVAIYNQEYQPIPIDSYITGELGALYYVLVNKGNTR